MGENVLAATRTQNRMGVPGQSLTLQQNGAPATYGGPLTYTAPWRNVNVSCSSASASQINCCAVNSPLTQGLLLGEPKLRPSPSAGTGLAQG